MNNEQITRRAQGVLAEITAALLTAQVAPEAFAEFVPTGRRLVLFTRPASMVSLGEGWRLGTLFLTSDANLRTVGHLTRAAERGRVGYQSVSREERRDIAAAALRGGFAAGVAVNYDTLAIDLSELVSAAPAPDLPVGVHDGEIRVRWRPEAPLEGAPTLQQYLSERAELLIHPPLSAT